MSARARFGIAILAEELALDAERAKALIWDITRQRATTHRTPIV